MGRRKDWLLTTRVLSARVERADVIPRDDGDRPHVRGRCWCEPTVERVRLKRLRFLVAHNATDARELTEETGVN